MKLLLIVMIFVLGCSSSDDTTEDLMDASELNENEIGMAVINITREGKPLVKASSDTLIKSKNSNPILQGNVNAYFFNEDGAHISTLVSKSAHIDQRTNNLHAYGDVIVTANDCTKLFSNSIVEDLNDSDEIFKFSVNCLILSRSSFDITFL